MIPTCRAMSTTMTAAEKEYSTKRSQALTLDPQAGAFTHSLLSPTSSLFVVYVG
jgi:hypothetical protein